MESHVAANVRKMLSSAVKPLGKHVIPAKSNLHQWWKSVESALQTAHPHPPSHLAIGGIENMGPILLGAVAWECNESLCVHSSREQELVTVLASMGSQVLTTSR